MALAAKIMSRYGLQLRQPTANVLVLATLSLLPFIWCLPREQSHSLYSQSPARSIGLAECACGALTGLCRFAGPNHFGQLLDPVVSHPLIFYADAQ